MRPFQQVVLYGPNPWRTESDAAPYELHGWMAFRAELLELSKRAPLALTETQWRRVVDHRGWKSVFGESTDRNQRKRDDAQAIRDAIVPWFNASDKQLPKPGAAVQYHGQTFQAPKKSTPSFVDDNTRFAMRLEIIELNHRGELRALDKKMMPDVPARDAWIKLCFAGSELVPSINDPDGGLGGSSVWIRRPYMLALLKLMRDWRVNGSPYLDQGLNNIQANVQLPSLEAMYQEYRIVKAFAIAFVEKFGRAPTAPRIRPPQTPLSV